MKFEKYFATEVKDTAIKTILMGLMKREPQKLIITHMEVVSDAMQKFDDTMGGEGFAIGNYKVNFTVNGKTITVPLEISMTSFDEAEIVDTDFQVKSDFEKVFKEGTKFNLGGGKFVEYTTKKENIVWDTFEKDFKLETMNNITNKSTKERALNVFKRLKLFKADIEKLGFKFDDNLKAYRKNVTVDVFNATLYVGVLGVYLVVNKPNPQNLVVPIYSLIEDKKMTNLKDSEDKLKFFKLEENIPMLHLQNLVYSNDKIKEEFDKIKK